MDRGGPDEKPPVDVDDRDLWAATNPTYNGRIREEKLVRLRRKLGRVGFARESLCVWPRQILTGADVIDLDVWEQRADADSRPGAALVFAVDVSPGGRSAAVASAGRRADGRLHGKIVDYRPGTGWVVAKVKALAARWNPRAFLLDPAGPAGALIADLQAAGVKVEFVTGREMTQACGAVVADLENDLVRHCDQQALNDAVAAATTRPSVDAWQWDRKDSSADICPLVAFTAALHGFRVHGAREEVVPWAEYA